ncbi:MAG: DNA polymerase IV [Lachnospiraceae bacterium]|nr:DNA polymerase IV [Candidatus Merdinaster equi]
MSLFFHIDVNSAFLSWTSVHNLEFGTGPDLRLVPAIIGGDESTRHGIVLAKSIPAKRYNIQTAEPIVMALRKCPDLIMADPDFKLYSRYSKALMDHLRSFCPEIEQVSIDECYMNYTPISHAYNSPEEAAHIIKDSVREKFGFTVNVGISDRKVLAKMASDFEKPDKVHTLYASEIKEKMWPLPVGDLFLCGKSSQQALHKLGIRTIGQLATTDPTILTDNLKSMGQTLYAFANGIDDSQINLTREREKSIGNSTTPPEDVTSREDASKILLLLADSVASRLRRASLRTTCVCVEIKYTDFKSTSRQMTLTDSTDNSGVLHQNAMILFDKLWNGDPIRLLGLRSTKLEESSKPYQLSLFDYSTSTESNSDEQVITTGAQAQTGSAVPFSKIEKQRRLDAALDSIRNKYGKDSVQRGSLVKR